MSRSCAAARYRAAAASVAAAAAAVAAASTRASSRANRASSGDCVMARSLPVGSSRGSGELRAALSYGA